MAETVAAALTAVRTLLDEASARMWEQPDLRRWLWEGTQDVARRTGCNRTRTDVAIGAGVNEVTVPAAVYKIDDVIWVPGGSDPREIPLQGRPWDILNRLWSQNPGTTGQPAVWTQYGRTPTLALRVYPAPYAASTLRIFGPTLPTAWDFTTPNPLDTVKTLDVPDGWTDLVVHYAVMKALLADKDAGGTGWQVYANLYEAGVQQLIENDQPASYPREFAPNGYGSFYGWDD